MKDKPSGITLASNAEKSGLLDCFMELLREKSYIVASALTLAFCYGYRCVSFVPGIDDLATEYYRKVGLLEQGRFTAALLSLILGFFDEIPYAETFLGILLFGVSAVLICAFLRSIGKERITAGFCTVFTCIFLSCSLIPESFCFFGMPLNCGVSFIGTTMAVYLVRNAIKSKKARDFLLPVCLLIFVISLYESYAAYYVSLVFAVFIFEYLTEYKNAPLRLKTVLLDGLKYLLVLIAAVLLELLASTLIMKIAGVSSNEYYDYTLTPRYLSHGFISTFVITLKEIVLYHVSGFWTFPVAVMNLCILILLAALVISAIKTKSVTLPLLFAGLIFSLFLMSLITGEIAKPRNLQNAYFVNAFAFALLFGCVVRTEKKKVISAFSAFIALLIIWQGGYMNKLFYVENNKRTVELAVISDMYHEAAESVDVTAKPLIVVGHYPLNDTLKKQCYISADAFGYRMMNTLLGGRLNVVYGLEQNDFVTPLTALSSRSTVEWTIDGLRGCNTELYEFFDYLGFSYLPCSPEQYDRACAVAKEMPEWGSEGCIKETEEFIVVKLFN